MDVDNYSSNSIHQNRLDGYQRNDFSLAFQQSLFSTPSLNRSALNSSDSVHLLGFPENSDYLCVTNNIQTGTIREHQERSRAHSTTPFSDIPMSMKPPKATRSISLSSNPPNLFNHERLHQSKHSAELDPFNTIAPTQSHSSPLTMTVTQVSDVSKEKRLSNFNPLENQFTSSVLETDFTFRHSDSILNSRTTQLQTSESFFYENLHNSSSNTIIDLFDMSHTELTNKGSPPTLKKDVPKYDTDDSHGENNDSNDDIDCCDEEDDEGETKITLEPQACYFDQYSVTFEEQTKLGILLERKDEYILQSDSRIEHTIVKMVLPGEVADLKGVTVGSTLVAINDVNVRSRTFTEVLNIVQEIPRPMKLLFERGRYKDKFTVEGVCFLRKGVSFLPPSKFCSWTRQYFVFGGAVAPRNVLQFYQSQKDYQSVVLSLFQNKKSDVKYKTYEIRQHFKITQIKKKKYRGQSISIKYFAFQTPTAKVKTIKVGSESQELIAKLYNAVYPFLQL